MITGANFIESTRLARQPRLRNVLRVSIHGQGMQKRAGGRARSLPPSFLREERDSTVFVASLSL